MNRPTLVVWFSCGAASAVTAKLCLAKYADTHEITIARCVVANEHPDNERFALDCEKWFGQPIISLKSEKYKDCWEVWEGERFLKSPFGAPCTKYMKRIPRAQFEEEFSPSVQAYGYTVDEVNRAETFRRLNPHVKLLAPLIDETLRKSDCLAMIERAGIEIPVMYKLGFNNNNCIGCVKGGMGYWNHIRKVFPDVFERMTKLEKSIGASILRNTNGDRLYLDELPLDAGKHNEPEIDCSLLCVIAEDFYREAV